VTVWDLLGLCRRFWLITICGLALTVCAVVLESNHDGVYAGQVNVILLAPQPVRGNALADTTDSLISLAGVLARITGGPGGDASPASDTVALAGEGVLNGYSIHQPNSGNQFGYLFDKPILDIQAVGDTLPDAHEQMDSALTSIRATLSGIEAEAGVVDDMRVGIELSPNEPTFAYEHGSRIRAVGITSAIGIALTLGAVIGAEQITSRRRHRRSEDGRPDRPSDVAAI
jgi:hypothetical protein